MAARQSGGDSIGHLEISLIIHVQLAARRANRPLRTGIVIDVIIVICLLRFQSAIVGVVPAFQVIRTLRASRVAHERSKLIRHSASFASCIPCWAVVSLVATKSGP
jgi:hypothetical protein